MILASLLALLFEVSAFGSRPAAETRADSIRAATPMPESLYVALLETGPAYRVGGALKQQPGGPGHSAYMRSLTVSGVLVLGGPYGDDPERRVFSGAILLLRAASIEEARRIVGADPGIASGLLRVATVSRWIPAAGALARALRNPTEGR